MGLSLSESSAIVKNSVYTCTRNTTLFSCTQGNETVTHLQLAGNNIGALGTVYLKTVLTLNQNVTYLVCSITVTWFRSSSLHTDLANRENMYDLLLAGRNIFQL